MRVLIETIAHGEQRYPTVGDYVRDEDGTLHIFVSDLGNWKYELLVALHELIEAGLCQEAGVTFAAIDAFDADQSWPRPDTPPEATEPGEDPAAPYHRQHRIASAIEQLVAERLNVDWIDYTRAIEALE
jgi:hypothetical protein